MYIVNKIRGEMQSLPAKEIKSEQMKAMKSELAQKILKLLSEGALYPIEIAKKLKQNEQKIYYHVHNLEKAGIIKVVRKGEVRGVIANYYGITEPAFVIRFKEFQTSPKLLEEQPKKFLEPFVENGQLNATIIVGSPDPHGPDKARSRDGYYGMDFALFLGSFLNYVPSLNVLLDTEAREEDLQGNLILIGGPVVNTIVGKVNSKLPIRFEKKDNWSIKSGVTGKKYYADETGIIVKAKNPFNPKKSLLLIAGKRYAGTRAVMIAFLKHFKKIFAGNKFNEKILAKVVEGVDLDSDGIVDEVEILE